MKKTLYDVLQVSKFAEQDFIDASYKRLLDKYQSENGNESQNQIKFITHAYAVLSDPNKKSIYDKSLEDQGSSIINTSAQEYQNEFSESNDVWWKSPVVVIVFIATLTIIGYRFTSSHKDSDASARHINELEAAKVSKHLDNEAILVNGATSNQIGNYDLALQEEERKRIELEYRQNANAQILDMQRRELDARLEMQRKQQEDAAKRAEEQKIEAAKRAEELRAQRQLAFFACYNSAYERYGEMQARAMCQRN